VGDSRKVGSGGRLEKVERSTPPPQTRENKKKKKPQQIAKDTKTNRRKGDKDREKKREKKEVITGHVRDESAALKEKKQQNRVSLSFNYERYGKGEGVYWSKTGRAQDRKGRQKRGFGKIRPTIVLPHAGGEGHKMREESAAN